MPSLHAPQIDPNDTQRPNVSMMSTPDEDDLDDKPMSGRMFDDDVIELQDADLFDSYDESGSGDDDED